MERGRCRMLWTAALVFGGVSGCAAPEEPPPRDTEEPPTTTFPPVVSDGPTHTVDTAVLDPAPTAVTGDTGPELDCSVLPPVPVPYVTLSQFETAEDFDFDGNGNMCTMDSSNLVCRDRYGGPPTLISPNVAAVTAGTRVLITGDWVVADSGNGALIRIDGTTGAREVIATGLEYPNGVEVDADNMVYVAENNGGRVRQIDAYTGDQWLVTNDVIAPNGVILSPDGNVLYVGSFGGGLIYAIDRIGPTEWDAPRVLYDPPANDGGFDGINVDVCGNVYITEFTVGRVYRISPDGVQRDLVVDLNDGWIPNMRWGTNIGGWRSNILYVSGWQELYALDVGIEGKKHILAP